MQVIENILSDNNLNLNTSLNYLLSDIKNLNGVGDKICLKLTKLINGNKIIDLLYHFPISVIDRSYSPKLIDAEINRIITIKIKVLKHIKPYNKSQPYKVICSDGTDYITINFFGINPKLISNLLEIETEKIISGKLNRWHDQLIMSNPDIITTDNKKNIDIPQIEPVYPLTSGISNKFMRKIIKQTLNNLIYFDKICPLPEWLDKFFIKNKKFKSWIESITNIHNPQKDIDITLYKKRIAYDEILASQLLLGLIRDKEKSLNGISIKSERKYINQLVLSLPFTLTESQQHVVEEILIDMGKPKKMIRLVQGDVGSGKTIIALIAMLNAIECGYKCLLMAPTEILAKQHFDKINNLLNQSFKQKVKVEILTGKDNIRQKQKKLQYIEENNIDIIIGTHALFQRSINISNIGLIVIDEQHRFGVNQRLMLSNKGINADILSMSATPIPRTLAMTIWRDIDISTIEELPRGRKLIDTKVISTEQLDKVVRFINGHILQQEKVYWVCPLIEESEKNKLVNVEFRFNYLKTHFEDTVGMIHGKMSSEEKDKIMKEFSNQDGKIKILVATTVIEVGVDNPDATIIVIENSERFGLSVLHQLRGRVGRGIRKSTCILIHNKNISDQAKQRISIMKRINNGFEIAEEDLKIRGAGDILGTDQSGIIKFKIADYYKDKDLFCIAKDDIKFILNKDPNLTSDRGKNLRFLLKIFEKNYNIDSIYSG